MKNIILVLLVGLFSLSVFADSEKMAPWPRLTVWPDSVDVWVQNYDDRQYRCSGTVWMYLESGRTRTEFVSFYVFNRSSAHRRIINYNRSDKIRSAHHTISCF